MDLPRTGEDALAQPTRAHLFALLVEERAPASTEELAERLGMHPNGVRRHLERLQEEGLVARSRVRAERGRPRDSWSVAPDAHPAGERPRAYGDLARWLTRAIATESPDAGGVEREGRKIGRELAPAAAADPVEAFRQTFAAMGFQPRMEIKAEGEFSCCLGNCPYRDSARESPDVVCGLHRGITAGLLSALDPEATLVTFQPGDPDHAGCLVEAIGVGTT